VFVKQRQVAIVGAQVALIVLSAAFAWLLRFEFTFPQVRLFLPALPLLVSMRLLAMAHFNLFHGYWRYTGMSDAVDIVKAVALRSMGFLIAERWIFGATSFPISVYFIEAILTAGALGGVRMLSRAFMQSMQVQANGIASKTVVVIGAGCGAGMLLRKLPRSGYTALALVDDDPAKAGVRLHGVRVAGTIEDLPRIVRESRALVMVDTSPRKPALLPWGRVSAARGRRPASSFRSGPGRYCPSSAGALCGRPTTKRRPVTGVAGSSARNLSRMTGVR